MNFSNTKDTILDTALSIVLVGVTSFILLPGLTALLAGLSANFEGTLYWVSSTVLGHILPHFIIGGLLGVTAGAFIRHKRLFLAILPAIAVSGVYLIYQFFGPSPYESGTKYDFLFFGQWIVLLIASFLCALPVLRKRQTNKENC